MMVRNSLISILGLLALMMGFQNCSLQDSGSGSFSSKSQGPLINPLPDVQDNIYIPTESANSSAGTADQQPTGPAPEGSVEQLLEKGLVSDRSFQTITAFRAQNKPITFNPDKNS